MDRAVVGVGADDLALTLPRDVNLEMRRHLSMLAATTRRQHVPFWPIAPKDRDPAVWRKMLRLRYAREARRIATEIRKGGEST